MDNLAFNSLGADEASLLELLFEEREVLEVVKGMHRDKAPGRMGSLWLFSKTAGMCSKLTLWESFQIFTIAVNSRKASTPPL